MTELSCHVMVDIETMSTKTNAAIVSIGACAFDIDNQNEEITRKFEVQVSLQSNQNEGRDISASTVEWWLRQSPEAQAALFKDPVVNLRQGITMFRMWVQNLRPKAVRVWAKDPDFDTVILKTAFDQFREIWPFEYWASRSVRTITELAYPNGDEPNTRVGVHHSAADDAVTQALMVRHCYHALRFPETSGTGVAAA